MMDERMDEERDETEMNAMMRRRDDGMPCLLPQPVPPTPCL